MTLEAGKGPKNHGASFLDSNQRGRSRVDNQTHFLEICVAVSSPLVVVRGALEGGEGLHPGTPAPERVWVGKRGSTGRGRDRWLDWAGCCEHMQSKVFMNHDRTVSELTFKI